MSQDHIKPTLITTNFNPKNIQQLGATGYYVLHRD